MIDFCSKKEFFAAGLDFKDLFEEFLFDYFILKDGKMFYDPATSWMNDSLGNKIFFVISV